MKRKLRGLTGNLEGSDNVLLAAVSLLLLLGAVVVYGAGSFNHQAAVAPLGQHFFLVKHLSMIGLGILLMVGLMHVDYHWYKQPLFMWGGLLLGLVLVAVTLMTKDGRVINRWVTIMGFTFQPVEIAKLALIFFLAERLAWLKAGGRLTPGRLALVLAMGPLPLIFLLINQPNFGNVLVIAGVSFIMMFIAGVPIRWLGTMLLVPLGSSVLAFTVVAKLGNRLSGWLQGVIAGDYPYQVRQSLIGLGAGGWRGLGVGQSHNKFFFLPESHTDFAYSVLGEELGLVGTLGVIGLLATVAWRGWSIAQRATDPFGRLVATGLTGGIILYGVTNIAMVTGLVPVIGVPLPFVSYGGTAMLSSLAALGILLNIDRTSRSYQELRRRWQRAGMGQT